VVGTGVGVCVGAGVGDGVGANVGTNVGVGVGARLQKSSMHESHRFICTKNKPQHASQVQPMSDSGSQLMSGWAVNAVGGNVGVVVGAMVGTGVGAGVGVVVG
jgi:hypothetical protein